MEQLTFDDLEVWKPVVGYEGLYEISSHGQVKSLPRLTVNGKRIRERIMKPYPGRYGHLHLNLFSKGRSRSVFVHHLVAEAFIGPRPPGQEIRHLDGNPANNRWAPGETEEEVRANGGNLIYGTNAENHQDMIRHGTNHNARKTHCPQKHKYTPENTFYDKKGGRGCRKCRRARGYARYLKNKKGA